MYIFFFVFDIQSITINTIDHWGLLLQISNISSRAVQQDLCCPLCVRCLQF